MKKITEHRTNVTFTSCKDCFWPGTKKDYDMVVPFISHNPAMKFVKETFTFITGNWNIQVYRKGLKSYQDQYANYGGIEDHVKYYLDKGDVSGFIPTMTSQILKWNATKRSL